ncbi:hypothetical protein NEMBOFW57_010079 [Staphylotrichum longicolle]|uniref:tRNA wybutosine-synthesizing protein 2 n=1 Tax=Staphylotrichum longicolle TaxID=669026 RepID=A0AAD4HW00_9PEZI|nr:hypothetical protein NEMBOFW57_010079 [Staphylotrichum longicolle]
MARPPKPKQNPVQTAVRIWLDSLPAALLESLNEQLGPSDANKTGMDINGMKQTLLDRAPKRWVVYEPMVLLPKPLWTAVLHHISPSPSKPPLTHLAINEGIPLHLSKPPLPPSPPPPPTTTTPHDNNEEEHQQATRLEENLLRAPTSLHPLHGAFGPSVSSSSSASSSSSPPTPSDFAAALWVTTKQNGLHQTWAPLHTMFSRGNVKEKARLLAFHSSAPPSPSQQQHPRHPRHPRRLLPARALRGKWAVDLYAGIGYFTLSYAALGLRVLCWELNPWSVEGLRRGARMNGFEVRVVTPRAASPGEEEAEMDMEALFSDGAQIVVFLEDNAFAARRVREAHARGLVKRDEVVHVNCGFLPSSEGVWRDAFGMVGGEGWLHLHENVGVGEIEGRKGAVQGLFDGWAREDGEEKGKEATVEHVELVKTYAPDVWHCVFDVFITRSSAE